MIAQVYNAIGGSYDEAKRRLGSDRLIERFVLRFPDDPSFHELTAAMQAKRWAEAFPPAHTLKGVALNLSFDVLSAASTTLCNALRPENRDAYTDAALTELYAAVEQAYRAVTNAIAAYTAN